MSVVTCIETFFNSASIKKLMQMCCCNVIQPYISNVEVKAKVH